MIKTLALLGILGGAGALSICNLCNPGVATTVAATGTAIGATAARAEHAPSAYASVMSLAPVAAAPAATDAPPRAARSAALKTVAFKVKGMTCGGCVIGVRTVLTRLPGVSKADVSYEQQRATVTYDDTKVTAEQMIAAIKTLGYTATAITA